METDDGVAMTTRGLCPARPAPPPARLAARRPRPAAAASEATAARGQFVGAARPTLPLPSFLLQLSAPEAAALLALPGGLDEALACGTTAMVLSEGGAGEGGGAAALFDAAVDARARLRGRALLFVADRADGAAVRGAVAAHSMG